MQTTQMDLGASGDSGVFGSNESASKFSVQFTVLGGGGSPVGQVDLYVQNEDTKDLIQQGAPTGTVAAWSKVGPVAVLAGADLSVVVPFDFVGRRFKLVYTRTSGTGKAYYSPIFAKTR